MVGIKNSISRGRSGPIRESLNCKTDRQRVRNKRLLGTGNRTITSNVDLTRGSERDDRMLKRENQNKMAENDQTGNLK